MARSGLNTLMVLMAERFMFSIAKKYSSALYEVEGRKRIVKPEGQTQIKGHTQVGVDDRLKKA